MSNHPPSSRPVLEQGLEHYAASQRLLSSEISPVEAADARELTSRSLTALVISVVAVMALDWLLHEEKSQTSGLIALAVPIALSCLLVTRWRVSCGARIVLCLSAVLLHPVVDDVYAMAVLLSTSVAPQLDQYSDPIVLAFCLAVAYLHGWLIDAGAATHRGGRSRPRWSAAVTTLAIAEILLAVAIGRGLRDAAVTVQGMVRPLLLLFWCWYSHAAWFDARRYGAADAATVFYLGMMRWQRRLFGRVLALCSVAVIAVATLNGFALPHAFELEGAEDHAVVAKLRAEPQAELADYSFFWLRTGRLLRESDWAVRGRSFYAADALPDGLARDLQRLKYYDGTEEITDTYWRRLATNLEPWRIHSAQELQTYFATHPAATARNYAILMLDNQAMRAAPNDGSKAEYWLTDLRRATKVVAVEKVGVLLDAAKIQMLGAAIFASLSLIILWRRGGDSKAALWVGIWLAGVAMAFARPIILTIFNSIIVNVSHAADSHRTAGTVSSFATLLYGFANSLTLLTWIGPAAWLAWRHLRTPLTANQTGRRARLARWLDSTGMLCIGCVLSVVIAALALRSYAAATAIAIATASTSLLIAAVAFLRRRYALLDDSPDHRFRITPGVVGLYLFASAVLVMSFSLSYAYDARIAFDMRWFWPAIFTLLLFGALAGAFLLRSDWLRLAAGRDLSWLATALVLPLVFELANNALPGIFESIGIFLPDASSIAGVLVVVVLLQPIQHGLEAGFEVISAPMLHRVRRRLAQIVENNLTSSDEKAVTEQIELLFKELGISGYGLWLRQRRYEFVAHINSIDGETQITLSEQLCHRLATVESVIDLQSVHAEWAYFFDQFELHRLAGATKGRYLYCLQLGGSLSGLLVLTDSAETRGVARDAFIETANEIGTMLFRWRR